jgi:hypothetical protein
MMKLDIGGEAISLSRRAGDRSEAAFCGSERATRRLISTMTLSSTTKLARNPAPIRTSKTDHRDGSWRTVAATSAAQLLRQDRIVSGPTSPGQASYECRLNTESGFDNLFGNGVRGQRGPLEFLAKSPRRKERNGSEAWLIPPKAGTQMPLPK